MNFKINNALIISPHPDDETLGVGGSIKRFTDNNIMVSILIVCAHMPPLYSEKEYKQTIDEAKNAFEKLGVRNYKFLNVPATKINGLTIGNGTVGDVTKLILKEFSKMVDVDIVDQAKKMRPLK